MSRGLLLDRNGIIPYPRLLSQQLTYKKGASMMEITRKKNWTGCIINRAGYIEREVTAQGWKG